MKSVTLEQYWNAIDMIEAKEMLLALNVADYPSMKTDSRRNMHRKLHEKAFPKNYEAGFQTSETFANMFGGMINGRR